MSQRFGIDVSRWQGSFDFARAKSKEGVEFAIIKAGGADSGLYKDSQFEANYKKCVECGLPKGHILWKCQKYCRSKERSGIFPFTP